MPIDVSSSLLRNGDELRYHGESIKIEGLELRTLINKCLGRQWQRLSRAGIYRFFGKSDRIQFNKVY